MEMSELEPILRELRLAQRMVIYTTAEGVEVSATRTDKICPHDFGVGLTMPGRPIFFPTHVRLFIDRCS